MISATTRIPCPGFQVSNMTPGSFTLTVSWSTAQEGRALSEALEALADRVWKDNLEHFVGVPGLDARWQPNKLLP
jgi:hypothetical protein